MMSCSPVVLSSGNALGVVVGETRVPLTVIGGSPVVVETAGDSVSLTVPATSVVVLETIQRGPAGPAGPQGPDGEAPDYVWPASPNSSLSYSGGLLSRVDYADGTYKVLAYDGGGRLVTVSGINRDGDNVVKSLFYTGGLLSAVSSSISP